MGKRLEILPSLLFTLTISGGRWTMPHKESITDKRKPCIPNFPLNKETGRPRYLKGAVLFRALLVQKMWANNNLF